MSVISVSLRERLRASLQENPEVDGLYEVKDMEGYFCSLKPIINEAYTLISGPFNIDGKEVYLYIKVN